MDKEGARRTFAPRFAGPDSRAMDPGAKPFVESTESFEYAVVDEVLEAEEKEDSPEGRDGGSQRAVVGDGRAAARRYETAATKSARLRKRTAISPWRRS